MSNPETMRLLPLRGHPVILYYKKRYFWSSKCVQFVGTATVDGRFHGRLFDRRGKLLSRGEHDEHLNLLKGNKFTDTHHYTETVFDAQGNMLKGRVEAPEYQTVVEGDTEHAIIWHRSTKVFEGKVNLHDFEPIKGRVWTFKGETFEVDFTKKHSCKVNNIPYKGGHIDMCIYQSTCFLNLSNQVNKVPFLDMREVNLEIGCFSGMMVDGKPYGLCYLNGVEQYYNFGRLVKKTVCQVAPGVKHYGVHVPCYTHEKNKPTVKTIRCKGTCDVR